MKISKKQMTATFMTAVLAGSLMASSVAIADVNNGNGTPEEQADITNWIANTPQQISKNMAMQHINTNNLNGTRYIIQWGDTLSGISSATGISVRKLCYDNNIQNANLIFAGNVLILNHEGTVPTDYNPNVNPYAVAQTKVTINNGPTTVNIAVQPHAIVNNYDESDNSDHSKTIYKAVENNSSNKDHRSNNDGDKDQSHSTEAEEAKKYVASIRVYDIVKGLEEANNDEKLTFDIGTPGNDEKKLDIDSGEIVKDVKNNDYDALLDKIKDALGTNAKKGATINIHKDDGKIYIYAGIDDSDNNSDSTDKDSSSATDDQDKSSSSKDDTDEDENSSDSDSSQSHDDDDNNKQADTNDQNDDTSDDE